MHYVLGHSSPGCIGAVGIEMATELRMLHPDKKITLIHSRDRVLSAEPLPSDFQDRVGSLLREAGVKVIFGQRVIDITAIETEGGRRIWKLELADRRNIYAGHVMNAVSKCAPTSSYLPKEALTEEGYVKIQASYAVFPPLCISS